MKKEPSNSEEENKRSKYTLPRAVILRGKKNFERLFSDSSFLRGTQIDFKYQLYPELPGEFRVAFIAGKRLGKAVQRNKAKRQMREAFRHHQSLISDALNVHQMGLHGIFFARKIVLDYTSLYDEMQVMLHRLSAKLGQSAPNTNLP